MNHDLVSPTEIILEDEKLLAHRRKWNIYSTGLMIENIERCWLTQTNWHRLIPSPEANPAIASFILDCWLWHNRALR